jgi:hypothetical protein
MGFLRFYLREGSYHRKQPLHRSHRQTGGRRLWRGCIGEVGHRERDHPLDPRKNPHYGDSPEDLLGGDAHQRQSLTVKRMSWIDNLDRVHGEIREGNAPTYRCIVFGVFSAS